MKGRDTGSLLHGVPGRVASHPFSGVSFVQCNCGYTNVSKICVQPALRGGPRAPHVLIWVGTLHPASRIGHVAFPAPPPAGSPGKHTGLVIKAKLGFGCCEP